MTNEDIIAVVEMNRKEKKIEVRKTVQLGPINIQYHWRSRKNLWGRFGGGWNWKLGIMAGGHTVIIECLVFALSFSYKPRPDAGKGE